MAFVECPFNKGHRMPETALQKHMLKCPDRPLGSSGSGTQWLSQCTPGVKREAPSSTAEPPSKSARTTSAHEEAREKQIHSRTSSTTLSHLTEHTFESLDILPDLKRSINEVFGYTHTTKVQDAAIPFCMTGEDVVAKAKTGTGKTLGFLIPSLHNVLSSEAICADVVQVLVLSPTRELAMQTAEEAKALLKFMPQHSVMTMLGGTNMSTETSTLRRKTPLAIVATPGRLNDHLENSGLAAAVAQLRILILDEADQLLDMGFRPAIEKILKYLPSTNERQTLLFSATFPEQLQSVSKIALRQAHEVVDCIGADEEASNQQVEQRRYVCSFEDLFATAVAILSDLVQRPHKILVFLPTAREASFYAGLLSFIPCLSGHTTVLEIHSRMTQNARTKVSDQFRLMSQGILCSSDVSARGMDYPDVTYVLQIGSPPDKAQYLHRLGRTARAGKEGSGLLLLCDFERFFLNLLQDLPVIDDPALWKPKLHEAKRQVTQALPKLHEKNPQLGGQTYQAWLGDKNSRLSKLKWSKAKLVEMANHLATGLMKLPKVPALEAKTVGKMGLKGVPGLAIQGQ